MNRLVLARNIAAVLLFMAVLSGTQHDVQASCDMPYGWPLARLATEAHGYGTVIEGPGAASAECADDAEDLASSGCLSACTECSGDWGGGSGSEIVHEGCESAYLNQNGFYQADSEVLCVCS